MAASEIDDRDECGGVGKFGWLLGRERRRRRKQQELEQERQQATKGIQSFNCKQKRANSRELIRVENQVGVEEEESKLNATGSPFCCLPSESTEATGWEPLEVMLKLAIRINHQTDFSNEKNKFGHQKKKKKNKSAHSSYWRCQRQRLSRRLRESRIDDSCTTNAMINIHKLIIGIIFLTISLTILSHYIKPTSAQLVDHQHHHVNQPASRYRALASLPAGLNGRPQAGVGRELTMTPILIDHNTAASPQPWSRGGGPQDDPLATSQGANGDQLTGLIVTRNLSQARPRASNSATTANTMRSVHQRHIVSNSTSQLGGQQLLRSNSLQNSEDICSDRLCYGLPGNCLGGSAAAITMSSSQLQPQPQPLQQQQTEGCKVLVTSKRFIDPTRPVSRDILFELIALPEMGANNYAAIGFSENGRMQGLVSECLQYRDDKTQLQIIKLRHSYNVANAYTNVPVTLLSGIKNLGVSFENGYYQCRWIVESAVEFAYEAPNGTTIVRREDLGYKNYHILLATGEYNEVTNVKGIHTFREASSTPVSLAQTGQIKSLGSHILIRIHGSLMIAIWVGLVTLSIVLARYYKNEWSNSKINDSAIWFVIHRALMATSWFGSVMAVIFAYMYTETYHPGLHQVSGTTCLVLTTIQLLGGLFRPSQESSKRVYFNWTHFICGNLSYLFAMVCLITAAFLAPAHLPPLYIWVIVIFVGTYTLTHMLMTIHQYMIHKSSKISITPMSDLNSTSSTTYTSCNFVADSYPKEVNSPFRQFMLGILVTVIVIFIVLLISLVNIK